MTLVLQVGGQDLPHVRLVIDNQYLTHRGFRFVRFS
jgi:hypothetical protein